MDFQTLGTVLGAGAGALVGNPMIGAGIGGSIGASLDSNKAKKTAATKAGEISPVDSNVVKFLHEINNQRLSYKTGTGASFYIDEAKEAGASAVQGALQLSGGNTGAALSTISGVSRGTSKGINSILAELERNNQFNTTLVSSMVKDISQRSLEVNLAKYAQANAEAAQKETNKNSIINSLVGLGVENDAQVKLNLQKFFQKKLNLDEVAPDDISDSDFFLLT